MKVVRNKGGYPGSGPGTAVAMGFFDGVHIGHAAVIHAAREYAQQHGLDLAVFTFSRAGLAGDKGKLLQSPRQKHDLLAEIGVKYCFEPPFESFCDVSPEAFFEQMLRGRYKAKALFCGEDFAFGKGRAGDVRLLRRLCEARDMALSVVPLALYEGDVVSSSRIRAALGAGDLTAANAMLGRPYEIDLPVRHGKRIGRKLGFPTLNQVFPAWLQPPEQGVYITQTVLRDKVWPSVTGYGTRPTVGGKSVTCETYLPGYSGNLYGKNTKVRFFSRIASVRKFSTEQELAAAVQHWAQQAVAYFGEV